jgi:DNA-binding GntR family transcriptional regulator
MRKKEHVFPIGLFSNLDRSGPASLYVQLAKIIESEILSGSILPGTRLENEVSFGERLGISRPTIRRAIQELVNAGLLVRRRGVGTQVVLGRIARGVELTSLHDDVMRSGKKSTSSVLELKRVTPEEEVLKHFPGANGLKLLYMKRIRKVDGSPVSIMQNWLGIEGLELSQSELESAGLYELLRLRGISLSVATQRIGARKALPIEAELLEIERGAALLTMERIAFDHNGQAVELGTHVYRPDLYSFETTLLQK